MIEPIKYRCIEAAPQFTATENDQDTRSALGSGCDSIALDPVLSFVLFTLALVMTDALFASAILPVIATIVAIILHVVSAVLNDVSPVLTSLHSLSLRQKDPGLRRLFDLGVG